MKKTFAFFEPLQFLKENTDNEITKIQLSIPGTAENDPFKLNASTKLCSLFQPFV